MVDVGQPAPDFTLPSHTMEKVSLSEFQGQKSVVLSFHIYSFTGGWTHQVSSMRMSSSEFEEKNTQVLGISTDPRPTQTAFASSLGGVPYPLLGDFHPKGKVAELYGVYNEERGTANRSVFIIDKGGTVRFKRVYANMSEFDMGEILDEVGKL